MGGKRRWGIVGIVLVVFVVAAALAVGWQTGALSKLDADQDNPYPAIDEAGLTDAQRRIVTLTRAEFASPRPGTAYSEGVEEDWCANFVSWIMNEAGAPFMNPNSGWWRIPGVYTLTEYFESQHRFVPVAAGYQPKVGDVVLYSQESRFGQHTNIVLGNDDGVLTTIGGNELGGKIRVSVVAPGEPGIVGFGRL